MTPQLPRGYRKKRGKGPESDVQPVTWVSFSEHLQAWIGKYRMEALK